MYALAGLDHSAIVAKVFASLGDRQPLASARLA
jgi:hypothetical protein